MNPASLVKLSEFLTALIRTQLLDGARNALIDQTLVKSYLATFQGRGLPDLPENEALWKASRAK